MTSPNRQVGEAVAWRWRWEDETPAMWTFGETAPLILPQENWTCEPLIPASDLEQVSRERDGLEDALRGIVEVCGWTTNDAGEWTPSPDYPGDIAKRALNDLDNRNGRGP